jgi:8-oxo-dGTP pyrophosphatase MutT (NUDIX family)
MNIKSKLKNYHSDFHEEIFFRNEMLDFFKNTKKPFNRETKEGHFTASAFLLNSTKTKFLLMHHVKLNKWLQLGGHADGEKNLLEVAIKEAKEESGISNIISVNENIFDIDIHIIPLNNSEIEHKHYDVRFLLKTINNDVFIKNSESKELAWIDVNSYNNLNIEIEYSIKRMIVKYQKTLY